MTKLTTERLEELANATTPSVKYVGREIIAMARQLLAYEQAAKNKVALPEALKYAEIYGRAFICVDRSGSVHAVNPSQITLTILNETAPVLPKQHESESIICWSCKKTITLTQHAEADGFCPLCDAEIELEPAQPVIPEHRQRISDDDLVAVPRSVLACAGYAYGKAGLKDGNAYAQLRTYFFAPAITAQPVSEPYKLEIDMDDADQFSITHLHEIIYGKELIWPEAKLLARFMLDVKQRASAAPAQESE